MRLQARLVSGQQAAVREQNPHIEARVLGEKHVGQARARPDKGARPNLHPGAPEEVPRPARPPQDHDRLCMRLGRGTVMARECAAPKRAVRRLATKGCGVFYKESSVIRDDGRPLGA